MSGIDTPGSGFSKQDEDEEWNDKKEKLDIDAELADIYVRINNLNQRSEILARRQACRDERKKAFMADVLKKLDAAEKSEKIQCCECGNCYN